MTEEFFVEVPSHFAHDHVFGRFNPVARLGDGGKESLDLGGGCELKAVEHIHGVAIDRYRD